LQLTFLGDVFLPDMFNTEIKYDNYIFNLESPVTNTQNPLKNKVVLKIKPEDFTKSFDKLPLAVCLANNHILDYNIEGFNETINYLDSNGIKYFGAGTADCNFNNPLILKVQNKSIALFGYVDVFNAPYNYDKMVGVQEVALTKIKKDINKFKNCVDKIIVNLHWGAENVYLPSISNIKKARQIIDMGADLIIGHHPHCIQPYEIYKGKYIFYSLGNLIFPDCEIPAFYNNDNISTYKYNIKNLKWNRKSISVHYDLENDNIEADILHFTNNELKLDEKNIINKKIHLLNFNNKKFYNYRYRANYLYRKIINKTYRTFLNPKNNLKLSAVINSIKLIRENIFEE